ELGVSDYTDPSRSHHSCLGHYGFTLEENSNDKVFIYSSRDQPLCALASSWPKDSLYIHQDGKPSLRFCGISHRASVTSRLRASSMPGSQISVKNEIRVRKWVAEKCGSVLKDLPKSLLEDRVILQDIDKLQNPELPLEQA
ncbi:hypothetical protein HID58_045453, partial [Brassica napus]